MLSTGKYGVSQPWYFPILPRYWCGDCGADTGKSGFNPSRGVEAGGSKRGSSEYEADGMTSYLAVFVQILFFIY